MGYESPIEMICGQMRIETENAICKAVQEVGINVDKEELQRALAYDREQYQKGYNDREKEIVRCKDCTLRDEWFCVVDGKHHPPEWYCAGGVRIE